MVKERIQIIIITFSTCLLGVYKSVTKEKEYRSNDLIQKRTDNRIFRYLVEFSFVAAEVNLQVKVDFVAAAQVREIPSVLHVGHASGRVATMHIFTDRHHDCTVVAHINDRNAIVLQLCYINIRAAAIDGQP